MIGKDALIDVPKSASPLEVIVFKGIVRANLGFKPISIYSTPSVDEWPDVRTSEFFIELRDEKGKPLNREAVEATAPACGERFGERSIAGRIAWREGARQLLLFRREILIAGFSVAPLRPELSVTFDAANVSRGKKHKLQMSFSPPEAPAFMQFLYQWKAGRYRTHAICEPVNALDVDFSTFPGGKECRLIVAYTSGLRTRIAKTNTFSL